MTVAVTKTDAAHAWLDAQIKSGRFAPGHRLVLSQLAEEMGTSVVPVREAVRRLEAEGLIRYTPNVGATVAIPDENQYDQVMDALAITEGAATALAAPLLEAPALASARSINGQLELLVASVDDFDPERFTALNRQFHQVLFAPCPNRVLTEMVRRCWHDLDRLRATTFSFIPGRAVSSVREHAQLLELIETGAGSDQVERVARDHRLATLHAYHARIDSA